MLKMSFFPGNRLKTWSLLLGSAVVFVIAFISYRKITKKTIKTSKEEQDECLALEQFQPINTSCLIDENQEQIEVIEHIREDNDNPATSPIFLGEEFRDEKALDENGDDNDDIEILENIEDVHIDFDDIPKKVDEIFNDLPEEKIVQIQAEDEKQNSLLENFEVDSEAKHAEARLNTHSQKSKIPHYSQSEKKIEAKRNIPNVKLDKPKHDPPSYRQKSPTKVLRFGIRPLKKSESEENLKRKYKSLFRSNQPESTVNIFPDIDAGREHSKVFGSSEHFSTKPESLITDEDGSNLLVESGFFDNDLMASPDAQEPSPAFGNPEIKDTPSEKLATATSSSFDSKDEISNFITDNRDACADEAFFIEQEEELIINLAIQDADSKVLLDVISKCGTLRLMARGFQALADFSKDESTHELYLQYLTLIYSRLDLENDALKVDILKTLLNLSKNPHLLPYLLSAKAPDSLLKYFLLDIDEEVQLTWLAFVMNIFDYWKKNKTILPTIDNLKKDNSVFGMLFGNRSTRIMRSRVYLLTRHRNRHISHVARQIYADMSRKDGN